ncbi:MAG: response regulator [Cyanobacteria bacterium P01_H01_bin.74]
MKILSVDDSKIIRVIFKNIVETLGYELLEAENGKQALEVLEANYADIALIILDWNMPVMDGFTCLQEIKANENFKHIPVMMATTEGERTNIIKAVQAGAQNYVTKPFNQEDLMIRVSECLGEV